ncbi:hypothetical protein C0991_007091 [Blastosporella zonata]|nr:hypothetical protein C0991_007091 [Blastosporella zonata]
MSSAFDKASLAGNGHPIAVREHQNINNNISNVHEPLVTFYKTLKLLAVFELFQLFVVIPAKWEEKDTEAVLGLTLKTEGLFESCVDVVDADKVDENDNEVGRFMGTGYRVEA